MNKTQQIEQVKNTFTPHERPKSSLSDAIEDCLERGIQRMDHMFLLICQARAAYITSRVKHREEDYVGSYNARIAGTDKLRELDRLLNGLVDR
jgi:hypothetical protein